MEAVRRHQTATPGRSGSATGWSNQGAYREFATAGHTRQRPARDGKEGVAGSSPAAGFPLKRRSRERRLSFLGASREGFVRRSWGRPGGTNAALESPVNERRFPSLLTRPPSFNSRRNLGAADVQTTMKCMHHRGRAGEARLLPAAFRLRRKLTRRRNMAARTT
jgi:hypothetical protein